MISASDAAWAWLTGSVAVVSATLTWISIAYARRRQLFDLPGRRRSHSAPTPRGGGIGIVGAVLVLIAVMVMSTPQPVRMLACALFAAVCIVAAAGWVDDHRGLRARTRFAAHCVAAAIVVFAPLSTITGDDGAAWPEILLYASAAALPLIAIVWSINLHNFMDGIDGILATQAVFVLGLLAWIFLRSGDMIGARTIALCALSVAAFVPFNFPRARIFMGDVGSGAVGLVIGVCVLWQMVSPRIVFMTGLIACSAFTIDATLTLLSRMVRGRRWYSAHREHLYQWLVRSRFSHVQVVSMYMAWNILIVLPVVLWMNRSPPNPELMTGSFGLGAALGVHAAGCAVWWAGKRACLRGFSARKDRRA